MRKTLIISLLIKQKIIMALLNTHTTIKEFIKYGFSEDQAEVIVNAINDQNTELVTKNDLKFSISELKSNLTSDISKLEYELKSNISELKVSIAEVKIDILKWILPFVATNTLAIIGLIITAFWRS
jgi:hypothetical protein